MAGLRCGDAGAGDEFAIGQMATYPHIQVAASVVWSIMKSARKRKIGLIGLLLTVIALTMSLVLYALRQNISLFYSPTQIANGEVRGSHSIRVGGMVVPGSIVREQDGLTVHFQVTDFHHQVDVEYRGTLPDLFREGQGIVAQGVLLDQKHFRAVTVLAKHDEKYMPPEVRGMMKEKA